MQVRVVLLSIWRNGLLWTLEMTSHWSRIKTYCGGSAQYAPFLLNSEANLRVSIAIINLKKGPYFCGKDFLCIYYRFSGWKRKAELSALCFIFFLKVRLSQYLESSQENLAFFQRRA